MPSGIFLYGSPPYPSNPELTQVASLASLPAPDPPTVSLKCWSHRQASKKDHLAFLYALGLEPDPHA